MKINPQRFTTEEFQDQASWIGKLFQGLNKFTGDVVTAFGNSLSVEDNLHQEIREIKWVNKAQNFPLKFKTKFSVHPKGLAAIYLLNNTTGNPSDEKPGLAWSYNDGQVTITSMSGLTADTTYTIRLLVIYS